LAQAWSGEVTGEIVGQAVRFDLTLSNIDGNAPDGLMGDTEISIDVSIE